MNRDPVDMLNGPLAKNIVRFTVPIILMGVMQNLFIACDDMLILGIFSSSKSLAAVGATTYLVNLFVNTFLGLSVGVNVAVAHLLGAGEQERTGKAVHTAVTLSTLLGLLLLVVGFSLSRACLELMGTPPDIIDQSALYLRVYFFSTPATLIFSFGSAVLRAQGDTRHPFQYLFTAGCTDVVLNIFFVTVCKLDVAGVALGTVLSQILSAVLILRRLAQDEGVCRLHLGRLGLDGNALKEILRTGIPAGINNMVFSISNTQIQSSINLFGSSAVAGCAASSTMESFVYASTNSVMQAAVSFVGQNTGAKRYGNVPRILRWCLFFAALLGTALGAAVFLIGPPLFSHIVDDPAAVEYAMLRTEIVMLPYMLCGMMEVFAGTLRGLGYSMLPTAVTLVGACGFRILWIYTVFQTAPTLNTLFLSFPISWGLTMAAHGVCYAIVMRKRLAASVPTNKKNTGRC